MAAVGVAEALCEPFSKRSDQIAQHMAESGYQSNQAERIHAEDGSHEAPIMIGDGCVFAGSLPPGVATGAGALRSLTAEGRFRG